MSLLSMLTAAAMAAASVGTSPPPRVYVPNQSDATVSVIDIATRKLVETVDLRDYGFGDNAKPHHVQVEPDGSAWYVTLIGAGKVLKLDRKNKLLGSATMEVPGRIAMHPTKDLMFVARSMSAVNPPQRMVVIRRSDMKVMDEIGVLFPRPHAMVAHPNGSRVYTASLGTNQFASIGVDDGDVKIIDVPGKAHGLADAAVSSDGRWMAVTAPLTDQLLVFDITDAETPKLVHRIPMPDNPFHTMFTGDGRWIFVTALNAHQVAVVDTKTWSVVDTVQHQRIAQPHGLALSPDGQSVFVSNRHQRQADGSFSGPGALVAICTASREVEATVAVGQVAAGIGSPVQSGKPTPAPSKCK